MNKMKKTITATHCYGMSILSEVNLGGPPKILGVLCPHKVCSIAFLTKNSRKFSQFGVLRIGEVQLKDEVTHNQGGIIYHFDIFFIVS